VAPPTANAQTRVGALTFNTGENELNSAVIDAAGGFAYFGTFTSPGRVIKVRLSDFTRVGVLTLNPGEDNIGSAVIDASGGFVYFGTMTWPGIVVKVRLSDFTRVGALTLNTWENDLNSAVIDAAGGFVYFGTATVPGKVVKVRLSDFTRVGALTFNTGENDLHSAVIDAAGGFAYFGTISTPGIVVKVRLSDFERVGALTLNTGENNIGSAVIDAGNGFAYFGMLNSPGIVVKVRLSDFSHVGVLTLNPGEDNLWSAVIDTGNGFVYFGTYTWPGPPSQGRIVKVRLSDLTRVGALTLNPGEDRFFSAVIDVSGGFAYFGTSTSPGIVVKVNVAVEVTVQITITSNPAGSGFIKVDGAAITTPQTFSWTPGIMHSLEALSPVSAVCATGTRYIWLSWSDGGAQAHTYTTPSTFQTVTANYKTQYKLTLAINPPGGGSTSPPADETHWYDSGSSVQIQATPTSGYNFQSWTGTGSGSYTGTSNPATVTVNAAITQTANFVSIGEKGTTRIVLDASPKPGYANTPVTISGVLYGSWRRIRDGVVINSSVTVTTGWGFSTVLTTNYYGQFSVSTSCPSTGATYQITATFYEDQDLKGNSTTIQYQVIAKIPTTITISYVANRQFEGYLRRADTGAYLAYKPVKLTVTYLSGTTWQIATFDLQTRQDGYYSLEFLFYWKEANILFGGDETYTASQATITR